MAKRPEKRSVSNDEERVLHFEWHAAHFRSIDEFLPQPPRSSNLYYGMPASDFHAATMRFTALRKFLLGSEPVRLDLVAEAMKRLAIDDQPHLVANLDQLIDTYKDLTKSPGLVKLGENELDLDAIFENILNGLLIHADVERRDLFDELPIGTIHSDLIHQWKLRLAVLEMLATVEEGREQGYLKLGTPYRRVWEPNPRA